MNQKMRLTIHKKATVKTAFLVQLQTFGRTAFFSKEALSQTPFYENCEVLQKVTFAEKCCATASDFL